MIPASPSPSPGGVAEKGEGSHCHNRHDDEVRMIPANPVPSPGAVAEEGEGSHRHNKQDDQMRMIPARPAPPQSQDSATQESIIEMTSGTEASQYSVEIHSPCSEKEKHPAHKFCYEDQDVGSNEKHVPKGKHHDSDSASSNPEHKNHNVTWPCSPIKTSTTGANAGSSSHADLASASTPVPPIQKEAEKPEAPKSPTKKATGIGPPASKKKHHASSPAGNVREACVTHEVSPPGATEVRGIEDSSPARSVESTDTCESHKNNSAIRSCSPFKEKEKPKSPRSPTKKATGIGPLIQDDHMVSPGTESKKKKGGPGSDKLVGTMGGLVMKNEKVSSPMSPVSTKKQHASSPAGNVREACVTHEVSSPGATEVRGIDDSRQRGTVASINICEPTAHIVIDEDVADRVAREVTEITERLRMQYDQVANTMVVDAVMAEKEPPESEGIARTWGGF